MVDLKRTYAVVVGRGEVPFDMLRYDACFPDTSDDAASMHLQEYRNQSRAFVVATHAARFTPDRWKSFGWGCVEYKDRYTAVNHCKNVNSALFPPKV